MTEPTPQQDRRVYAFHHPMEISAGGGQVYCRTEGSNEFLQLVFRKAEDIPDADKVNWYGPYSAPDSDGPIEARFDVYVV